jgi:uncharacterized protein YndB with AHSA1/START domain
MTSIDVDQFLAASPDRVWKAITTPDELARWWAPGDIAPVVGHRFLLDMGSWGQTECEVLEVVEPERFVYTFAHWTLTWTLVPEGNGTRLLLDHSGFDPANPQDGFAFDQMGPGWRDSILPRLAALLAP